MKKDNLNSLFENLKNDFDTEMPKSGHKQRFLNKLNKQGKSNVIKMNPIRSFWRPIIGIAASVVLLIYVFIGFQKVENTKDLANVSPEMANTQSFFSNVIAEELDKLNAETSPEAQILIQDAMNQMKILENEYEKLKLKLSESGEDQRVIFAMISNFQSRIEVLQNVLDQIEQVKQLKNYNYENNATI